MVEVNELLVLDFIREHGSTTRVETARALGLSQATVGRIVGRLLNRDVLIESPDTTDTPGRPASRIRYNGSSGAVIAVDLGGTKCHGALADLTGTVIREEVRQTRSEGTAFETLIAVIAALEREADARGQPVNAVAIGVPAIVNPATGIAIEGPNVEWTRFALVDQLREHLTVPFVVDNDVKFAAIAEAWRGGGRDVRSFVTVSIGTGIGAAAVVNGELLRGQNNAAGEIGYFVLDREQLRTQRIDGLGGFESVASGPAIVARATALLLERADEASLLRTAGITSEAVFAAASAGDELAGVVIDEVLDYVAIALIGLVGVLDPTRIILEGGVGRSLRPYLGELRLRMAPRVPAVPEMVVSGLGPNGTVVGAIATALRLVRHRSTASTVLDALKAGPVVSSG